jgi:hypothetical protein
VVALLTGGWRLPRSAVPATLLDLAARRLVSIEGEGPDRTVVRIPKATATAPPADRSSLTSYEQLVLDHVRQLASDGVVPCEALTTGPPDRAGQWWRRFRKSVIEDARRRGLSRPRWTPAARGFLFVSAILPAVAIGIAVESLPDSGDSDPGGALLTIPFIAWCLLVTLVEVLGGERETPSGLVAAGRWLGLRRHLTDHSLLAEAPPTAVATWDRYLSWGAALGVAESAVHALPMGAESDREAWSAVTGRWRLVRVSYPDVIPPGWGRTPGWALVTGLIPFALLAFVLSLLGAGLGDVVDAVDDLLDEDAPVRSFGIALLVIGAGFSVLFLYSAAVVVLALSDLWARRTVRGRVLRLREVRNKDKAVVAWRVAVDDGAADRIRAWKCPPRGGIDQGAWVEAVVTPRLGHVISLRRVSEPRQVAGSEASEPA